MATFRSDVLDISYTDLGDPSAAPVILAHGWPDAARGWREVAEQLVESGWRVLLPDNRGSGATAFRQLETVRDGSGVALAQDILDLADGLGLDRFPIVGHDWGARAAYTVAALAPHRVTAIAALALAFQPRGAFVMPSFSQARAFWYQWLMYVDAGVEAIERDPVGYAREQWDTWSPPGWFDDDEFAATATAFGNPDWPAVTVSAYRARFRHDEPLDARYDSMRQRLAQVDRIDVATLMIQGAADYCDEPASSEGLDGHFRSYRRVVLDGVGHFPHREAPAAVADLVRQHLDAHRD